MSWQCPCIKRRLSKALCLVKAQDTLAITEAYSLVHLAPVAVIAPLAALAWVAVSGSAGELVVEGVVQDLEIALGDAVLVVVGPALDHRIEGVDETCLRRTAMLLDAVPQLVSMALQRLAVGFDEGLEISPATPLGSLSVPENLGLCARCGIIPLVVC
jgi:hypothetical protein